MAENISHKEFLLNFKNKLEIDTSGSTDLDQIASAKFEPLAAGITTITPAAADTTDASAYYDSEGFTDSTVTVKTSHMHVLAIVYLEMLRKIISLLSFYRLAMNYAR